MQENTALTEGAAVLLGDARSSIRAVSKNTRLRMPYIRLVLMNNIFRAFLTHYEFGPEFKAAQEAMLETLCRVEARKNRRWTAADIISVVEAMNYYEQIVISCTEHQITEILVFVEENQTKGKYLVMSKKNG